MTPARLRELADRCEREEPSRELDVAIAQAVWPQLTQYQTYCVGDDEPLFFADPFYKRPCPIFTTSLDAAVTLVPEGWRVARLEDGDPTLRNLQPSACVHPNQTNDAGWGCAGRLGKAPTGEARSMALALCAAALRARAALMEGQS